MRSSRFLPIGNAFKEKCELLPYPCGLVLVGFCPMGFCPDSCRHSRLYPPFLSACLPFLIVSSFLLCSCPIQFRFDAVAELHGICNACKQSRKKEIVRFAADFLQLFVNVVTKSMYKYKNSLTFSGMPRCHRKQYSLK